jgi:hypothetical protein
VPRGNALLGTQSFSGSRRIDTSNTAARPLEISGSKINSTVPSVCEMVDFEGVAVSQDYVRRRVQHL